MNPNVPSAIQRIQRDLVATSEHAGAQITLEQTTLERLYPSLEQIASKIAPAGTPYLVSVNGSPFGAVFLSDDDWDNGGLTASLADQVQDYVIEGLHGSWPECAGHEHPMKAAVVDSSAVWICPETGEQIAGIGNLDKQRKG